MAGGRLERIERAHGDGTRRVKQRNREKVPAPGNPTGQPPSNARNNFSNNTPTKKNKLNAGKAAIAHLSIKLTMADIGMSISVMMARTVPVGVEPAGRLSGRPAAGAARGDGGGEAGALYNGRLAATDDDGGSGGAGREPGDGGVNGISGMVCLRLP